MNAATEALPQSLIDGVDVDAVARAARSCPGVEDLSGGSPGEVATYLPGRRVAGVRVGSRAVEVQVRAVWDTPVPQIAARIRQAVAPLAGGRHVDVIIADLGDPPGSGGISATQKPAGSGQALAAANEKAAASAVTGVPGAEVQAESELGWPALAGEAEGSNQS